MIHRDGLLTTRSISIRTLWERMGGRRFGLCHGMEFFSQHGIPCPFRDCRSHHHYNVLDGCWPRIRNYRCYDSPLRHFERRNGEIFWYIRILLVDIQGRSNAWIVLIHIHHHGRREPFA